MIQPGTTCHQSSHDHLRQTSSVQASPHCVGFLHTPVSRRSEEHRVGVGTPEPGSARRVCPTRQGRAPSRGRCPRPVARVRAGRSGQGLRSPSHRATAPPLPWRNPRRTQSKRSEATPRTAPTWREITERWEKVIIARRLATLVGEVRLSRLANTLLSRSVCRRLSAVARSRSPGSGELPLDRP